MSVSPAAPRRILLVDADAFYVAVARMVDPEGAGKAPLLIVGGSPEGRGVVCSASYETRAYGVKSAMPMARALRLCPRALRVPVPRRACATKSRQVRGVLARYAPVVEGASIDEWYLDLSGTERLYRDEPLAETAARIRAAVREETGLAVSIGGGTSKLVAKLAVERAKPKPGSGATGVHVVPPGAEAEFLRGVALADIPLVGPRFQERLARLGMRTVPDVLAHDRTTLARMLGPREGAWLYDRVRGVDDSAVAAHERAKSISRDETFARDIAADDELELELLRLTTRAAADLRAAGLFARTVTVRVRDADFKDRRASRTLPSPVITDRAVHAAARELLARLRAARRVPARLLSVALTSLAEEDGDGQLALFHDAPAGGAEGPAETERDRTLARTVDALRAKFGEDAIGPARLR